MQVGGRVERWKWLLVLVGGPWRGGGEALGAGKALGERAARCCGRGCWCRGEALRLGEAMGEGAVVWEAFSPCLPPHTAPLPSGRPSLHALPPDPGLAAQDVLSLLSDVSKSEPWSGPAEQSPLYQV